MTSKSLLTRDLMRGVSNYYLEDEGKTYVEMTQDVQPFLDRNHRLRTDGTGGWNKDKSMRRMASIPLVVWQQWTVELGRQPSAKLDKEFIKRKLNEMPYLRTAEWKL